MSRTPTPQQVACIEALGVHNMLKIEACAGGGKTSLLTMMAEAYKLPALYLAFNKVTADEGSKKFPSHVTCQTTHSKAYRECGLKIAHKLSRPRGGYVNVAGTGSEVARFYKLGDIGIDADTRISGTFVGLLVKATVARFEQSADTEISKKHVPTTELSEKLAGEGQAIEYVKKVVVTTATRLWADRINPDSPVLATHDTYLKMYQLSKPVFHGFSIVYVDEFQDTTPCVLDIIMNQRAHMKVVMVGDARQAIYGWRGAINAMMMVDCDSRPLTKSFRYGQAVADVATAVLERAMVIQGFEKITSKVGRSDLIDTTKAYTRLFRTNSALLAAAVGAIKEGKRVAIEIDTKDFVKVLESAQALYRGMTKDVKHDKIIPYQTWEEAKNEAGHDPELSRIVRAVEDRSAQEWIDVLQSFVSATCPDVTFTTAHKSKGREWSQVRVEEDFKSGFDEDGKWVGLATEEQNLLYVACTRAIDVLEYNAVAGEYVRRSFRERAANEASVSSDSTLKEAA